VRRLREIQAMSQDEGINLAGIKQILELQDEVAALQQQLSSVRETLESMSPAQRRVFSADRDGEISALRRGERPRRASTSGALVVWRPGHRS
jgi:MerR family transcriptional regulator/heat shock protein HspR